MPGRVKQHHRPSGPRAQRMLKSLHARMAQDSSAQSQPGGGFSFGNVSSSGPRLDKQAIIWISVMSVLVVATLIIVSVLLCRCTCSRKKREARQRNRNGHSHHASLEVTDGRNDHIAWNRAYAPGPRIRESAYGDGFMMTPLSKTAVRPAGTQLHVHPAEPVVVDEDVDPLTPVYSRSKGSRYYSGFGGAWKRVSQIGKAY